MEKVKSAELVRWLSTPLRYKVLLIVRDRYLMLCGLNRFIKMFYPIFLVLGAGLYFLLSNL